LRLSLSGRYGQIDKKSIAPLANATELSELPDFNDAAKLGSGKEMAHRFTSLIAIFENKAFNLSQRSRGVTVRVGMEASGHARWFKRLLAELNVELWIGDAAAIHRKRERKQKTDRQDAQHILRLLVKDDFPRIWVPSWENRDLRQLLWHRHRMVQARTRMMNQL
jgi:transposase